ncbi:hypothetical protein BGP84_14740 [Pseudomonas putida]|jgi:hypothetical protein|uniref:Short chain dehydrogenase n=1 Tax=Pseudomonas putida TaxID=303 RepID=A0A2S3X666_PSEPU|nr:hypothetical protein BGP84_14740 [Pseudomonas putida]POG15162.1 hypothetical protein BGP85_02990 [Pseudomonas putida]
MIDPTTGMKAGERYCVENVERAHQFPGFFLDGKYYLGPELLTAVGWLEGKRFIYDNLDASGEPVFPDRAAGDIENLTLTLVDGTALKLSRVEVSAVRNDAQTADRVRADTALSRDQSELKPDENLLPPTARRGIEYSGLTRKDKIPLLLSAAVIGFLAGFVITHAQRRRR